MLRVASRPLLSNIRKHGIDFVDVPAIFELDTITIIDERFEYGETRYQILGLLKSFARLAKMKDEDIDLSDVPEITPELFAKAIVLSDIHNNHAQRRSE